MRRIYLLSALSVIFLFAACKKEGKGGITDAFSIAGKPHNAVNSTWDRVNNTLIASDVAGNSIFVHFSQPPTGSRKYKIGEGLTVPDTGHVVISALRVIDTTSFISKGLSNLTATVIVNGNEIGVVVPYCDAYNPLSASEVIQISASIQASNFTQD